MASFSRNRRIVATTTVEESVLSAPSASESPGVRAPGGSARHCAVPFSSAFNPRRVAVRAHRRRAPRSTSQGGRRRATRTFRSHRHERRRSTTRGWPSRARGSDPRWGEQHRPTAWPRRRDGRASDVQHRQGLPVPSAVASCRCRTRPRFEGQAEQVRSVSVERIGSRVGLLTTDLQTDTDEALRIHLAL